MTDERDNPSGPVDSEDPQPSESRSRKLFSRSVNGDRFVIAVSYFLAAALFDQLDVSLVIGAIAAGLYFCIYKRNPKAISLVISLVISFLLFQWAGTWIVRGMLERTYASDVDHRMNPNNDYMQTNGDGVRCEEEADAFREEDFNIIFCGDSFTYGLEVKKTQDVFPYVVESLCNEQGIEPRVHCVSFGWTSSSPLLSLRLLKDIGAKYKPDLVVMALDLTDFHDDMRYQYGKQFVGASPTEFLAYKLGVSFVVVNLRERFVANQVIDAMTFSDVIVPAERFFIVKQPLAESLGFLVATERNLDGFEAYCKDTLNCEFIVVHYPRHFQYNPKECPDNWEAEDYDANSPYKLEPFAWMDQLDARKPYPCRSILDAFRASKEFPLYLRDDPHWSVKGHHVAAEAIVDLLHEEKLLPES